MTMEAFCGYTGIVNFVCSLAIGLFVLHRGWRNETAKAFALISFCVAGWSLGYFMWSFSRDDAAALFWARMLFVGVIFMPPGFLHFKASLASEYKRLRPIILGFYVVSLLYVPIDLWTDWRKP